MNEFDGINLKEPTVEDLKKIAHLPRIAIRLSVSKMLKPLNHLLYQVTDFLPPTAKGTQRLFHIVHDVYDCFVPCPRCKIRSRKFDGKTLMDYRPQCTPCTREVAYAKRDRRFKEKYGVSNPMQVKEFKEKSVKTNLQKYGVENPMQNAQIRAKTVVTNMERYGGPNPMYDDNIKLKISSYCMEKYGRPNYNQRHISEETWEILQNPEILKKYHHEDKMSLTGIATKLQVDPSTIGVYFDKYNIEKKYFKTSDGEQELINWLSSLNLSFTTRNRNIISTELDIYFEDRQLAIEYHGIYWHSEARWKDNTVHLQKRKECEQRGIRLIQIFEDEWRLCKPLVKNRLKEILYNKNSMIPDSAIIVDVGKETARDFYYEYSFYKFDFASDAYIACKHEGKILGVVGITETSDNIVITEYGWKYNFRSCLNKIAEHILNTKLKPVLFNIDSRWDIINDFDDKHWNFETEIEPSFYWVKGLSRWLPSEWNDLSQLDNYEDLLLPEDNMAINGFHRLWDAGKIQLKFVN